MSTRIAHITIDVIDPETVAEFWDESFVVMKDPAGNECCVLGANRDEA